jgi:DNA-binding sugar fermentation-stimulating protein
MPHPFRDEEFKKIFKEAIDNKVVFRGFFVKIDEYLNIVYDGELKLCEKY